MNVGYRTRLRRSSRIRQHSFPKTSITEPIDLVQSDSETMDQDGNQESEQNKGDKATGKVWKKVELKFARKSNNQPKETAKRTKIISNDKENDDENEANRRKRVNILYPLVKYTKDNIQKIEGAKHLNSPKDEVKLRVSPRILSEMIFNLTQEQRKWVQRSGFGLLFNFELEMLPAKLAYNVLQIFDHNSVSLKLKNTDI
ncbi:hypothetical protein ACET3Z_021297 [Daucus carota]